LNEIPQTPYYGTVDATPLFLVLVARHAAWTGELALFNDLRDHIESALSWISIYGDQNQDGYLEYQSSSKNGLSNQGWKDSGDAIVNSDGSLAQPAVSLVEVQGYVYLAKASLADLYERTGESARAQELRDQAEALRSRFNREFWLEERQFYALALQAQNRPAAAISSNPGQALWTGIVDAKNAGPTVARLLSEEMFSGWGIRTLSSKELRYNPIGYHLGTVWPHDNSLIVAGFRRYGFDTEACRVFTAIVEAAQHFEHYRLPCRIRSQIVRCAGSLSRCLPSSGLGRRRRSLFAPGGIRPDAGGVRAPFTYSSPRIARICSLAGPSSSQSWSRPCRSQI